MKHIKKRTKKAAAWRWKAGNVARKHGRAPLGAERAIRDGGEKASGLYGAEAWVSMCGNRYEELSAKQGRLERDMLGLGGNRGNWSCGERVKNGNKIMGCGEVPFEMGHHPVYEEERACDRWAFLQRTRRDLEKRTGPRVN